jgi:uncharacterized surface protein with fasciclin (FAS1) repeats
MSKEGVFVMSSNKTRRIGIIVVVVAVAAAIVTALAVASGDDGDSNSEPQTQQGQNIVETAAAAGNFDTLVSLVQKAGLEETLATGGPFTVFAPTDAAFAKVPEETLTALGEDPAQLKAVLLYHVAEGELPAEEVVSRDSIETLNGASVEVNASGDSVRVNDATVAQADVEASNGVIHVIDEVLLPPAN